jgi:hypothetical protein
MKDLVGGGGDESVPKNFIPRDPLTNTRQARKRNFIGQIAIRGHSPMQHIRDIIFRKSYFMDFRSKSRVLLMDIGWKTPTTIHNNISNLQLNNREHIGRNVLLISYRSLDPPISPETDALTITNRLAGVIEDVMNVWFCHTPNFDQKSYIHTPTRVL